MKPYDLVPFFFTAVISVVAGNIILKYLRITLFTVLLIAVISYLFFGLILISKNDFEKAGQLGDFFNPIVTLVSLVLALVAFKLQKDGQEDEKKRENNDKSMDLISDSIKQINHTISGISKIILESSSFGNPPNSLVISGVSAIQHETGTISNNPAWINLVMARQITQALFSLVNARALILGNKNLPMDFVIQKMNESQSIYESQLMSYSLKCQSIFKPEAWNFHEYPTFVQDLTGHISAISMQWDKYIIYVKELGFNLDA
jgi:hypothetical protein